MFEELIAVHKEVIKNTPIVIKRYLFSQINWQNQAICLLGARGVGKTTLMCQAFIEQYNDASKALYISADNIHVLQHGLFAIAQMFFKLGGETLFIDEIHKYPNWSLELKNIIDTYKKCKVIFSASSLLDLTKSKYDLSRRVVYYTLKGLSFREYLHFHQKIEYPVITIPDLLKDHMRFANTLTIKNILKHFHDYLTYGYFPFSLEGQQEYLVKVNNIIEKVIFEDIAVGYNLRQTSIPILKKLLWLVATSKGLQPNIERISKNINASRSLVYNSFEYLNQAGLLKSLYHDAKGMKLIRKPEKMYLENTNLLYAINGSLDFESDNGVLRETFFVNQTTTVSQVKLHDQGDFLLNDGCVIEVGGKSKTFRQIKGLENSYLAVDDIEIGFAKKIPLYLFGFLY